MRGGRRWRPGVLAACLAAGLLCLPAACVVGVRDDRLVPFRLAKGSMRWTYNPLGDLIELVASPLVCLALPVLVVFDPGLAGWIGLCLLPGFVTDALAFESDLAPAPGFATRLEGPLAAVAAELGRRRGCSAAVSPLLAGAWVSGIDPECEVEDLTGEGARAEEPVDGLTLLLPRPRGRRREPLSGPGLLLGPDVWPDEGRVRVEQRGRALLVRAGDEDWDAALGERLLSGPALPSEEDCRGPRVALHAGDEPLGEVVERLAAAAGRPLRLEGEPGLGRVSFHLQDLPWERALALVAWATGRELRVDRDGAAVLWAPADPPVTAAIRGAAPGPALALLARAAGCALAVDALPAGPITRLHLEQVSASEALPLAAELLGATLATTPSGELRALPAGPAVGVAPRQPDRPRRRGRRGNRVPAAPGPAVAPSAYDPRELLQLVDERLRRAFLGEDALSDGFEPEAPAPPAAAPGPRRGRWREPRELPAPARWSAAHLELLVRAGGGAAWATLLGRLGDWPPTWHPELRGALLRVAARALGQVELARLEHAQARQDAWAVLGAVPEVMALAARLQAVDPVAAAELRVGARGLAGRAQALALLGARSECKVQGVVRGDDLALALIDGHVLEPGDPLPDRLGYPRRDAVLVSVEAAGVTIRCDGVELERRLPE